MSLGCCWAALKTFNRDRSSPSSGTHHCSCHTTDRSSFSSSSPHGRRRRRPSDRDVYCGSTSMLHSFVFIMLAAAAGFGGADAEYAIPIITKVPWACPMTISRLQGPFHGWEAGIACCLVYLGKLLHGGLMLHRGVLAPAHPCGSDHPTSTATTRSTCRRPVPPTTTSGFVTSTPPVTPRWGAKHTEDGFQNQATTTLPPPDALARL